MVAAVSTEVTQAFALAAANFPAEQVQATQAFAMPAVAAGNVVQVTQAFAIVAARGRVADPRVRAWTFTLDGHDFYVLRCGDIETLVYDVFAEQWYVWGSGETDVWRAITGKNWLGGRAFANAYGSNVLVGDDSIGALYFLDPTGATDDDANDGAETPRPFTREITGQIATRSIDDIPCYGVQLIGSIGEGVPDGLTAITLYTSDDQGHTYDEHDTIDIELDEYDARAEWWSLGSFTAPGRLFKIKDTGALYRIDGLEMIEPPEEG